MSKYLTHSGQVIVHPDVAEVLAEHLARVGCDPMQAQRSDFVNRYEEGESIERVGLAAEPVVLKKSRRSKVVLMP